MKGKYTLRRANRGKEEQEWFRFPFWGQFGSDKAESRTKNGVGARFECTGRSFARVRKPDSYPFKISHRSRLLNRSYQISHRSGPIVAKKKGKNKKKPFRCFDVSTFPSFSARLARNEAQNRLYPRIVRRGKYVSKVCQSRDRKKKNRKNWVGKISAEILVPPARRS